jgi:RNA polymerase sigma-70 factor (ECF subfamily)
MDNNSSATLGLLERARAGDRQALGEIFSRHRERLRRMVEMRLDARLQARIDASDVIQDAYLEVAARLEEYLREPRLPLFLWLRLVVGERLATLHRHHLGVRMRDAGREVSLYRGRLPETTSAALAAQLLGHEASPSEAAIRAELKIRLQEALNTLDPLDREVLALRHFEHLSWAETGHVLGITEAAASKRYVRALKRLKGILTEPAGDGDGQPLDLVRVAAGVAVARLEGGCQRAHHGSVGVGSALLLALDVLEDGSERLLALEQSFGCRKRLLTEAVHARIPHIGVSSGTYSRDLTPVGAAAPSVFRGSRAGACTTRLAAPPA